MGLCRPSFSLRLLYLSQTCQAVILVSVKVVGGSEVKSNCEVPLPRPSSSNIAWPEAHLVLQCSISAHLVLPELSLLLGAVNRVGAAPTRGGRVGGEGKNKERGRKGWAILKGDTLI